MSTIAACILVAGIPAVAGAAPGDLAFVPGEQGCWRGLGYVPNTCSAADVDLRGANSIVVSPDGTSVYATSTNAASFRGSVVHFRRNASTGLLSMPSGTNKCITNDGSANGVSGACAAAPVLGKPTDITVSPDGKTVYVTVQRGPLPDDSLLVLGRDAATGNLTNLGCVGGYSGCTDSAVGIERPESVAVSPDGTSVYVGAAITWPASNTIAAFSRNTATGVIAQLPTGQKCLSDAAVAGCTQVAASQFGGVANMADLAVTPDGTQVITTTYGGIAIVSRNTGTGVITSPASGPKCFDGSASPAAPCVAGPPMYPNTSLAITADGTSVFGVGGTLLANTGLGILNRDAASGLITARPAPDGCLTQTGVGALWGGTTTCITGRYTAAAEAVAASPDGRNVYMASMGASGSTPALDVFTRDPATRVVSQRAGTAGCLSQDGYGGQCTADSGHADTVNLPRALVVSPDGANVYVLDNVSLLVLAREREAQPSGGGSASGGSAASGSGGGTGAGASPGARAVPRLRASVKMRGGRGTTTGTAPAGTTSVTQTARTGAGAASHGAALMQLISAARTKTARGKCTLATPKRKGGPRAYTCRITLPKGRWTVTTTARGRTGVLAEGSRRVTVK